ncbi:ADP-ribosyl cyclase/cyclic ADP-ribose hydrolase [Psidium guajava]|nr:ADP-ribosyl cyclase/cyclic ADP-ribose hydrolase [Psidium guajava]
MIPCFSEHHVHVEMERLWVTCAYNKSAAWCDLPVL